MKKSQADRGSSRTQENKEPNPRSKKHLNREGSHLPSEDMDIVGRKSSHKKEHREGSHKKKKRRDEAVRKFKGMETFFGGGKGGILWRVIIAGDCLEETIGGCVELFVEGA